MEEKRSRSKRSRAIDEGYWDCSVCTYKNSPEAFKCEMCDVRKGTSTRKPRINPQLVAQQVAQQYAIPAPKKEKKVHRSDSSPGSSGASGKKRMTKLKNIDRSSGQSMEVTVGSVTVVITDYKPKESSTQKVGKAEATDSSNNTSLNSTHNDSSLKSETTEETGSVSMTSEANGDISEEETS